MGKHLNEIAVTTWLPADLARELDSFLARQTAGRIGVKPSRQCFVRLVLREALDRAKSSVGDQAVRS